jgi:hypothetical protein
MALIRPTGGGRLEQSESVILDANGAGQVELGPVPAQAVWAITRIAISCTGPTDPMPSLSVYEGPARPANLFDATWTGTQDVSDFGTPYELEDGDYLTFRWESGTPGERATARLIGRQRLVT